MVKLMVILEANKSLAATFDPTETLRIILKTATSETDAERGTIFLRDPGGNELVSQILEGGSVQPIRLAIGAGIAGSAAESGRVVNSADAYRDPRFDRSTDASSGFKTESVLAAPMRTPAGEIVGVVEVLNKRRRHFTKEDEEFLAEVATHAALAVAAVREHEAVVRQAREEGAGAVLKAVTPLLLPAVWPEVPGFDAAPLRWRAEGPSLALYSVAAREGRLALLLLEHPGGVADSVAPLVRAEGIGRRLLGEAGPPEVVRLIAKAEPSCAVTAVLWEADRISLVARGAPLPCLLRFGRPVSLETEEKEGTSRAALPTAGGDLLVIASSGLAAMQTSGKPVSAERAAQRLARAAETQPLSAAFAALVSEWKKAGCAPGDRDVLLLAAKRL
jgi:putative methionine-R-sulfoxide reductase with GAF domain